MLQLSIVKFNQGSYLLIEGKPTSDKFYIIQTGKVRCFKEFEIAGDTSVNVFGPGDFIGVIPCMSGHSQIESVIALTDVTAIAVQKGQYPELIANNTPVALKVIYSFAARMRYLNEMMTKLTLKNVIAETPEQLFAVANYYETIGKTSIAFFAYYQYLKECPQGESVDKAKKRFIALKAKTKAFYLEPTEELVRMYPKGSMIFSECQSGQDMFIIQEGQVKISKVVDGNEVLLALIKKGDFFGEMALLENKPRSASAIAHENCKLMAVNRKNFDTMISTQPQMVARLTTTLSERLWSMQRQLANTRLTDPVAKLFDMLSLLLEKDKIVEFGKERVRHTFDITGFDLANMCGIPVEMQNQALMSVYATKKVNPLISDKLEIPDCEEVMKQAAWCRKQNAKQEALKRQTK